MKRKRKRKLEPSFEPAASKHLNGKSPLTKLVGLGALSEGLGCSLSLLTRSRMDAREHCPDAVEYIEKAMDLLRKADAAASYGYDKAHAVVHTKLSEEIS